MTGRRSLLIAGLFLAVWSACARGTAYGQGETWVGEGLARMVEAARWRVGALRLNAAFTLANAGYDSDVYYGYFETGEVPDWTLSASLPVQVLLPLGKGVVLDVSDTPQYLFYLDTERERAWNNSFRGQVHFALKRFYAQAGGGMSDVRRRFSPELDINIREKRDSLDGILFWQASRRTSLAVLYEKARYDYGDAEYMGTNIADLMKRDEDHIDLAAYVQQGSRARLFLDGQYGVYKFTGLMPGERDAKSYGIYAGMEFVPRTGELLSRIGIEGSFMVGYLQLDLVDPAMTDGSGFAGEADVSVGLSTRTSAHLAFSRGFQFSVYSGAAYYLSTTARAGLSHRLSRRATVGYDIYLGQTSYPEGGTILGRGDRFLGHTATLGLRLTRELTASLFGTISQRTRIDSDTTRTRYFLGLSLTYGFTGAGMPLPLGGPVR